MDDDSSPIVVIHASAAPDTIAGNIKGTVTRQKVRKGGTPSVTDASSTRTSICWSIAVHARTGYGRCRMKYETSRMTQVPVSTRGGWLYTTIRPTPTTVPGIA